PYGTIWRSSGWCSGCSSTCSEGKGRVVRRALSADRRPQPSMNMVVSHWSANVAALAVYAMAAAAHLLGMRGEATGSGSPRQPHRLARAVAYQAGLLLALLAVVSPMGYWSYRFIWARSLQDVILAIVAPALIVLGAPWRRLHRRDPRTA